jgi:hypothetical protein
MCVGHLLWGEWSRSDQLEPWDWLTEVLRSAPVSLRACRLLNRRCNPALGQWSARRCGWDLAYVRKFAAADLFAQEFGGTLGLAFGGLNSFVTHLSHINRLFVSGLSIHNLSS